MLRKLEAVTNAAILVVCILGCVVLIQQLRRPSEAPTIPQIAEGTAISIGGLDWSSAKTTLVLALATTCHFCTDSAPFYRRLAAELPKHGVHLVAVLPQSQAEGMEYLKKLDIAVDDVRQGSFRDLSVRGTPTLILVDTAGKVRRVWFGRLPATEEEGVIKAAAGG